MNEFRVVRIIIPMVGKRNTFHVLSLASNTWRMLNFDYLDKWHLPGHGFSVDASIYWIAVSSGPNGEVPRVIVFNLTTTFSWFPDLKINSKLNIVLCVISECLWT